MKKDTHKTKVVFLKNLKNEVYDWCYTYFPEVRYSQEIGVYNCYSHVGQHSACREEYAKNSVSCTKEEYKDLYAELTDLGYNLTVLETFPLKTKVA